MSQYIKEKPKNEEKHDLFYIVYSVAILVYLLAINNTMTSVLSVFAVIAVIPFLFRPEKFLPLLFACAINGEFFVAFQGISMARIFTLIFIVGMIIRMMTEKVNPKMSDFVIHGLLVLFIIFSCATSYSGELTPAFSFGLYIATLLFLLYMPFDRSYFLFGCSLISLVLSVFYVVVLVSGSADAFMGRVTLDEDINENQLAMGIAQLAAFNFAGYFVADKKNLKILLAAGGVCNVISLIFTGSRSAVIGTVVGLVACVILATFGKSHEVRGIRFSTLLIIAVGCAVAYYVITKYNPDVLERFSVDAVKESGGTGRAEVWELVWKDVFPAFPFFGLGYGGQNLSYYLRDNFGVGHGAHNFFFDILSSTGIAGLLIFISYTVVCLVKAIKTFRFDCSSLIPFTMLVTILFNGIGENTLGTRIFWFAAGLCLMISRQKRENKMPVAEKSTVFAKIRRKYEKT